MSWVFYGERRIEGTLTWVKSDDLVATHDSWGIFSFDLDREVRCGPVGVAGVHGVFGAKSRRNGAAALMIGFGAWVARSRISTPGRPICLTGRTLMRWLGPKAASISSWQRLPRLWDGPSGCRWPTQTSPYRAIWSGNESSLNEYLPPWLSIQIRYVWAPYGMHLAPQQPAHAVLPQLYCGKFFLPHPRFQFVILRPTSPSGSWQSQLLIHPSPF